MGDHGAGLVIAENSRSTAVSVIPVLLYHSISDRPSVEVGPYAISRATFERHLDLIQRRHQALSVSQLVDRLLAGLPLPEQAVVITFDDGFADNLEVAAPMLARRALQATVYVTTGYVGRASMLSWNQIAELDAMGVEIGAHAHTHTPLDELSLPEARAEIRGSKALLEDKLGHSVPSFAYPHGYSDGAVRAEVRAAGFKSACGVRNALSHTADDRWCIARLTVMADTSLERIEQWLSGNGAPIAPKGEALRTRVWRTVRRVRNATW
jgi:peptidoglycan/xylan/chitin deacetylase (PgdA/CDA1 family)